MVIWILVFLVTFNNFSKYEGVRVWEWLKEKSCEKYSEQILIILNINNWHVSRLAWLARQGVLDWLRPPTDINCCVHIDITNVYSTFVLSPMCLFITNSSLHFLKTHLLCLSSLLISCCLSFVLSESHSGMPWKAFLINPCPYLFTTHLLCFSVLLISCCLTCVLIWLNSVPYQYGILYYNNSIEVPKHDIIWAKILKGDTLENFLDTLEKKDILTGQAELHVATNDSSCTQIFWQSWFMSRMLGTIVYR